MSDNIINIHKISKSYKLYQQPIDRVYEALNPFKKSYHNDFHALNDVTFSLSRGQVLGIIGKNGNGKSTLLKIIAGVVSPTSGKVETSGRISAILELTSCLKLESSGAENILFNLKLNGICSIESEKKLIEIKEFVDLGEFLHQPVKSYSSGMKSRLGFAISIAVEPDILILDEVLAVGDFEFQQKCLDKINSLRSKTAILFVSHSMSAIRLFCDLVMVLERGSVAYYGEPSKAIQYYQQSSVSNFNMRDKHVAGSTTPFYGDLFHNKEKVRDIKHYWSDENLTKLESTSTDAEVNVFISFSLTFKPKNLIIGIPIWTSEGTCVTAIGSDMMNFEITSVGDNQYRLLLKLPKVSLNPGTYISIIAIVDNGEFIYRGLNNNLHVSCSTRSFGFVTLDHHWIRC